MGAKVGNSGGANSEINVTPLIDVVLVLLIIFIVIVPVTMYGYDVDIPAQSSAPPAASEPVEQFVLAIDTGDCPLLEPPPSDGLPLGCRVRLNDEVLPVTELAPRIADVYAARAEADRVLFLAADERLNYEGVMRIVDAAKSAVGGLRIGMVTEERPSASPSQDLSH